MSCFPPSAASKETSQLFAVGLVALKSPVEENGTIASVTAFVRFEEPLPIYAASTNARVFKAAENVFRQKRHLDPTEVGIKESFLCQAIPQMIGTEGDAPDGIWEGASVWFSAA